MSDENGPLLLTADECAALLAVSRSTFNGMIDGWAIKPIILGKRKRWSRVAVVQWIEQQSINGESK